MSQSFPKAMAEKKPKPKNQQEGKKKKKAESHNDGGGEVILGHRQGLPGCRVPTPWEVVVQGKGGEG